jgi:NADPH:quinone reductase-like Zn-dependent oxidoreductase
MYSVYATGVNPADPMSCLAIGDLPEASTPDDWVTVYVRAASLNHHDVWSLMGVALSADRTPMVLGSDAAGVTDDGREVLVHAVVGDVEAGDGDETLDPRRSLLSEIYPGAFAERVRVPARNLVDKPAGLTFEEACCLPTAWLTAYRMIAARSATEPGDTILVQGVGGGVSTALIVLGKALGRRVWVTSRDGSKRDWALSLGADAAFEPGARLPERVDAVMETVGEATWSHSLKCLRPGGTVVVSGATSGPSPSAELNRVFFLQLRIIGSTMGSLQELKDLTQLLVNTGIRPVIDRAMPMAEARTAFEAMHHGDVRGKLVLTS